MSLSRYSALDAYVVEELRREYESRSSRGRIRLLKKLQKNDACPPFEIAALAAQDTSSRVREWFARCGAFFTRQTERRLSASAKDVWKNDVQARNLLVETLKNDSDPFVRACLRENPSVFSTIDSLDLWKPFFLEATHMERLALMRNPEVGTKLVEKVFDPEETELGIDLDARKELCRAFLSNKARLHKLTDEAGLCPDHKGFSFAQWDAEGFLRTLWSLAPKWPENSDIPALVFNRVPVNGLSFLENGKLKYVKAEIYHACPRWRVCILFTCGPGDDEVIRLALQDEDEACRQVAYSKLSWVPVEWVPELITRKDKAALEGLAQNESLSVEDLNKIQKCLNEIDSGCFPFAWRTIERKQKATISQDMERLFGKDGRGLLEEKINFIGKTLAETKAKNEELAQRVGGALVLGVASVIILLYLVFR